LQLSLSSSTIMQFMPDCLADIIHIKNSKKIIQYFHQSY
jgi:hypothetical protein